MFKSYYHLTHNPFIKEIKVDEGYKTSDFNEAKGRLEYLKNNLGIGLFTGNSGVGKTFAIRSFVDELNPNLFHIAYVQLSTVSVLDFYKGLSVSLGLEPKHRKVDMFKEIQTRLHNLHKDMRKTPVIIIDEAQYLKSDILNDLKLLLNFSMDSKDNVILLLVGLPTLNGILSRGVNEALYQRITINYLFNGINKDEINNYIDTRLKLAKCEINMFEPQAIEALANCCKGSVRVLNNLIIKSLIIGAQQEKRTIDTSVIMLAEQEIRLM